MQQLLLRDYSYPASLEFRRYVNEYLEKRWEIVPNTFSYQTQPMTDSGKTITTHVFCVVVQKVNVEDQNGTAAS